MNNSTLQPNRIDCRRYNSLPSPSAHRSLCAWCQNDFRTIVELIDHVTDQHVQDPLPAAA